MQEWGTPKATADMIALLEVFGTRIERTVIEDAYVCCAHAFEPTLQVGVCVCVCVCTCAARTHLSPPFR